MYINKISLLGLLLDNFTDWWKFSSLWSVNSSCGVNTWHFQFKFWAAAWLVSFESFWLALSWIWFCLSGLLCQEALYWLHWLHSSISLWSGFSFHMSHRVDKQILAFFQLCFRFFLQLLLLFLFVSLFGIELLAPVLLFPGLFWVSWDRFLPLLETALFSVMSWFLTVVAHWLGSVSICLSTLSLTVFISSSSGASKPFIFKSLSWCVTICSYVHK